MTDEASPDKPTFVYIVRCADGTLYTGWTFDLQRRVRMHNAGRGARYTRQHRPVELIYWEEHPNRSAAQRREEEIKRRGRTYKEHLLGMRASALEPAILTGQND
jgi:putative endonuclease